MTDNQPTHIESTSRALVSCPITAVLDVASAKWTVEIMRELMLKSTRTRRFLAHTPGLTMKSLCQRLHHLDQLGLVSRKQFDEKPLRVEYSITDKGRRFIDLLNMAKEIADEWAGESVCKCPMSMPANERCDNTCSLRREARAKLLSR